MARRKHSRIALPPKEYKVLVVEVMQRDGWKCQTPYCGMRSNLHAHHIKFRSHGGDDTSSNLITLCNDCHEALHQRYILILPLKEREEIDADKGVRWLLVNNWLPRTRTRGKK